ncbi:MAG: radical SAM protein [Bacillota bacterium]
MKMLLVAINSQFSHSNLAVWYLKREAEIAGCDVEIFETNVNVQYHATIREILKRDFDVIGFSTYIFNRTVVEKLCCDIREARSEATIFVGGGEVYYSPNGMENFCDIILLGEGEAGVFDIASGKLAKSKNGECQVVQPKSVKIKSVVDSGYYQQQNKILYYESSRGCPFSCSYCLSGAGNTLKTMCEDEVFEDLNKFAKMDLKLLKFVDRTFNARNDRGVSILKHIISLKTKTCFHFEISPDLITDEFIQVVESSCEGQFQFEIGIQSFCERTLSEVSRFTNAKTLAGKIEKLIKTGKANVHVDLIVGLPFEDLETFKTSFNTAYFLRSQQLQVGFLKVLPGTKMEIDAKKYGMKYSKFPPYGIFENNWLSQSEVLALQDFEAGVEMFHNIRKFEKSLELLGNHFGSPFEMFEYLGGKIEGDNLPLQKKVEILLFALCEFENADVAESVVRFDYLKCCKDKKFKAPLKNLPSQNYEIRHRKDKVVQFFEYNPETFAKEDVWMQFNHETQNPVTGFFSHCIFVEDIKIKNQL